MHDIAATRVLCACRLGGRMLVGLVLEHLLLAVKFAVAELVDDEPEWVTAANAQREVRLNGNFKCNTYCLNGSCL
jgi:hypothetical protein